MLITLTLLRLLFILSGSMFLVWAYVEAIVAADETMSMFSLIICAFCAVVALLLTKVIAQEKAASCQA